MNRLYALVVILVIISNINVKASEQKRDSIPFRVSLNLFNAGIGVRSSNSSFGQLPEESAFLLSEIRKKSTFFTSSIEICFFDRLGVRAGYIFEETGVNESNVRNGFQDFFTDYTTNIPETNYENNVLPFVIL